MHAGDRTAVDQALDDPGGVGTAIDVIADMQQQGRGGRPAGEVPGDRQVQVGKLPGAAMDVANGVDTPARRQGGGRSRQLDHRQPGYRAMAGKSTRAGGG